MTRLELAWLARTTWGRCGVKLSVLVASTATVLRGSVLVLELTCLARDAGECAVGRGSPLWTSRARVLRGFCLVLELSFGARRARRRCGLGVLSLAAGFACCNGTRGRSALYLVAAADAGCANAFAVLKVSAGFARFACDFWFTVQVLILAVRAFGTLALDRLELGSGQAKSALV
jgi:hypothetical protein